jgi:uncharacterized membrane protein YfcA
VESELLAGLTVGLLALGTATLGSIGGLGGAVLLVPALVLLGWSPLEAAPIGIAMSAAGALAAVPRQTLKGLTNYRLGVSLEIAASIAAAGGALLSVVLPVNAVQYALGGAAIAASLAGGLRKGQRNLPVDGADLAELGDQPGRLASAYPDQAGRVIPYEVARFKTGLTLIGGAGLLAGLTGVSGGFIKTPVMSEVMRVPVKVAAATTMFMIGVTAAVTVAVYASQGRITAAIAPAVLGGLLGGRIGAAAQARLPAALVRQLLSAAMLVIGIVLVVRA